MSKKTKQLMATLALLVLVILQTLLSLPRHNQFAPVASDTGADDRSSWSRGRATETSQDWRARPSR